MHNEALHLTAILLRSTAAGELGRYTASENIPNHRVRGFAKEHLFEK